MSGVVLTLSTLSWNRNIFKNMSWKLSSACFVTAGQRHSFPWSVVTSLLVEGQRAGVREWGLSLRWVGEPAEPWADHSAELLAGIPVHRNPALHRPAPRISECLFITLLLRLNVVIIKQCQQNYSIMHLKLQTKNKISLIISYCFIPINIHLHPHKWTVATATVNCKTQNKSFKNGNRLSQWCLVFLTHACSLCIMYCITSIYLM